MSVPSEHGLHPGEDEARLLRFPGSENYDVTVHSPSRWIPATFSRRSGL